MTKTALLEVQNLTTGTKRFYGPPMTFDQASEFITTIKAILQGTSCNDTLMINWTFDSNNFIADSYIPGLDADGNEY